MTKMGEWNDSGLGAPYQVIGKEMIYLDAAYVNDLEAKLQQAVEALREQGETIHLVLSSYKRFAVHQGHTFDSCPVQICADARAALARIGAEA